MTIWWLILGIFVYLMVGLFITILVINLSDINEAEWIVVFWPIFIGLVIIFGIVYGIGRLAELLADAINGGRK